MAERKESDLRQALRGIATISLWAADHQAAGRCRLDRRSVDEAAAGGRRTQRSPLDQ